MLFNRRVFFDGYKDSFDPTLNQEQVDAIDFLLGAFENDPKWRDVRHVAYAFATIYHETAATLRPITEYGGVRYFDKYDTGKLAKALGNSPEKDGDGYKYRGRGFVQITGFNNYEKFGIEDSPEDALKPEVAFTILSVGMQVGSFTGKKLSAYIKGSKCDYINARKVINGTDKASLIAGYARSFEKILRASTSAVASTIPEQDKQETSHTPIDSAQAPPIVPLVPAIEVPQVVASSEPPPEPPKEDTLTKVGNKFNALWTLAGTSIIAAGTWLTSTPIGIAVAIIGAAALIGIVYMLITTYRATKKENREAAAKEIRDKTELELKLMREKNAHEIQMAMISSAADPKQNTVVIGPPPATQVETPQEVTQ